MSKLSVFGALGIIAVMLFGASNDTASTEKLEETTQRVITTAVSEATTVTTTEKATEVTTKALTTTTTERTTQATTMATTQKPIVTTAKATTTTTKKPPVVVTEPQTQITTQQKVINNNERIVYVGKTGTKYHKYNCRTLKYRFEMSLKEALAEGRQACKVCGG